ncbi:MAG: cytochrome c [Alphaproteobacteria bacterium]|nr:cytochrome c [Alphaproteobacteria bacterium]
MTRSLVIAIALAAFGFLGWEIYQSGFVSDPLEERSDVQSEPQDLSARIENGKSIYVASCAVCHGANLEGQPDWQTPDENGVLPAPPHDKDGHTWHHTDNVLLTYVRLGGAGYMASTGIDNFKSGMPGFAPILEEQEIEDVITYIKSTWPQRERDIQASRVGG